MEIVRTESLSKKYKNLLAVDNLSIHIKKGEIYGFLGLNGAGKTTTIRMLLGMIKPASGSFHLFGKNIKSRDMNWNDVGYSVETPYAYPNLTVYDNLVIFAGLRNLPHKAIDEIIERLHLTKYIKIPAGNLSQGNRQRLGIAKALMHKPALLILDEPTNGLDPKGIVEVRNLLHELAANGTTIFLSSHILSEISRLATRIGIIHEGRLVKEIYANELEKQLIKKLLIDTTDNTRAVNALKEAGLSPQISESAAIELADETAIAQPHNVSSLLVKKECPPKQLYTWVEDLEHYFLRVIEKSAG